MVSSEMENNLGSKNVLFPNFLNLECSWDKQEIEKPLVFKKNWRGFRKGENTWFQVKWRTIGEVKTFCFQVKWREIREGENACFQS